MVDLIRSVCKDTIEWIVGHPKSTLVLAGALVTGIVQYRKKTRKSPAAPRQKLRDYQHGVAYIHIFPREFTKKVINGSPYAIKLETMCRMNKIPYETVETTQMSEKEGLIPYLILDGEETADSSVIISRLRNYFNVETSTLSDKQKGIQRAVTRMLDDLFAVLYFWYRYAVKFEEYDKYMRVLNLPDNIRIPFMYELRDKLNLRAHLMCFSRYGLDGAVRIGEEDLLALENILGENDFFFGDEPSDVDATVFAHLTQIMCPDLDFPWKKYIKTNCPRLERLFLRMKERFWPDWDALVSTGTFK